MRLLQAARLSRLGDASTGIEKQDEDAQRYAALGGHTIIGTAADTDVSGDSDPWARPQLGPWLSDPALIRQYDGIVASHVDRLARSTVHFMRLLHWADEHHKIIITVGEGAVDFSSPMGKLLGYIISWLGEQELEAIKRRSKSTAKWLRANKYLIGKAPYGYRIVPKDDHKTLEPDPAEQATVHAIIERFLGGATLYEICDGLEAAGVPSPQGTGWHQQTVSRLLHNTALIGKRQDAQGKTVLRFDPLIDPSTWKRLQDRFALAARPTLPKGKGGGPLIRILYCGKCGGPMWHSTATRKVKGKPRAYTYYRCYGDQYQGRGSTCRNMIPVPLIVAWLDKHMTDDVVGTQEVLEEVVISGRNHDDEIVQTETEIRELDLDAGDYDAQLTALRAERARLKALPAVPDEVIARPTGQTVAQHWRSLDDAGRREYLLSSGARVDAVRLPPGQAGRDADFPRLAATLSLELAIR
jgi:site-specific DNA recombinase